MLLATETETPLAEAEPVKVTEAVELAPPTTEEGANVKPASEAGVTARVAVFEDAPIFPVMIAEVLVATPEVVTEKLANELPAGISTDPGTLTPAFDDFRTTTVPLDGAIPVKVTVPIETFPQVTEDGKRDIELNDAEATLSDVDFDAPFTDAMIGADWVEVTGLVDTSKVTFFAPAAIVTLLGTEAQVEPEVREITSPPLGAGDDIPTAPVAGTPPITDVGDTVIDEIDCPKQVTETITLRRHIDATRTKRNMAINILDTIAPPNRWLNNSVTVPTF